REMVLRQREASRGVGERDADRVRRRPRVDAVELLAPARQQGRGVARTGVEAIRDVVDEAAECVHRIESGTALRPEQAERLREAAAAPARDLVAVGVGPGERGITHATAPERA